MMIVIVMKHVRQVMVTLPCYILKVSVEINDEKNLNFITLYTNDIFLFLKYLFPSCVKNE